MLLLRWAILLTVEIDAANIQLHYVKICVKMCFGNLNHKHVKFYVLNCFEYVMSFLMLQVHL